MIANSYYSQAVHGPYELEQGGIIRGCKLAYATYGALNAAKDNAIIIPTWYSHAQDLGAGVYRQGPCAGPGPSTSSSPSTRSAVVSPPRRIRWRYDLPCEAKCREESDR